MAIKIHYDKEDDIFTVYDNEHKPSETIEFSEFLNIDIDKNKAVEAITQTLLESVNSITIECKNYRNNWFIVLVFEKNGKILRAQMPPLRKSEYVSPLIASCQ